MLGYLAFAVLGLVVVSGLRLYLGLTKNIELAKKTGLNYVVSPFIGIGYFWIVVAEIIRPILLSFSFTKSWEWLAILDRQESWTNLRTAEEKYGDTFMVVCPYMCYLKTSNAELNNQITTRRNDFLKPVDRYKIVDIFGRSILTNEGQEWRRHRKVVGPSFSEKSNKLVFEESLRQTEGMLALWGSQGTNTMKDLKVQSPAIDMAMLSLHVICAAGFGVPQLWPGENEAKLEGKGLPGFSTFELTGSHTMTLKQSLTDLLRGLFWFALFPPWMLRFSPFQLHKSLYRSFYECKMYFRELVEIKKKQMYLGESDKGTMDLMAPMIKASEEAPPDSKSTAPHAPILSKEEIIGNSFIFLFAGHETSANGIHFSILHLAMSLPIQRHMQSDIDAILGRDKPISEFSYYTDMPRLYNSMVGAVLNEQLRLMPAILNIPKLANGAQVLTVDGRQFVIPDQTFVHINCVGTNRNPRYWATSPSKTTGNDNDIDDFVPERWLPSQTNPAGEKDSAEDKGESEVADGLEQASFDTSTATSLFKPQKGSFISFSDGARACPGRRFAQVEITAVLSALFQKYSVEFDVADWASDEEVEKMGREEKRALYEKAIDRAKTVMRRSEQTITLQLKRGDHVPIRFLERGKERFADVF